ncbi:DUF2179 domain-containing protein [Phototrophicus methaneseepsis]|uniref:DUF2179 domain-containing protein n=1 Tax=Phototrophicus methaneseepsis TaxID=2710758 RepID=A0A7S8IEI5_9CHLR|nr:DUF5698 domain-containing protein [Phototrophicus methaneseepsis]QPC82617.1 DUF2179 domain-containing protein [Phototrophicus methaneseepsis]
MLEITPDAIGAALLIFALRVTNYSISTVRLVFIARSQRVQAACMAFFEAFIFVVVMASVITEITDIPRLLAYCLGASVGSYIGMWLESRFITSYSTVTIITREHGPAITAHLRDLGYGVTASHGEGRDGAVTIIRSTINNRETNYLIKEVQQINNQAFIEVEQARALQRGWIPGGPPRRR